MTTGALSDWSAFAGYSLVDTRIEVSLYLWGKLPGSPDDYRWLIKPPNDVDSIALHPVFLGTGPMNDRSGPVYFYRFYPGHIVVGMAYPNRALDADGRSIAPDQLFLVVERQAELPALGCTVFLVQALMQSSDWQGLIRWFGGSVDARAGLPQNIAPLHGVMQWQFVERFLDKGFEHLKGVDDTQLKPLYASLLSGEKAVSISGSADTVWPVEAFCALFAPMQEMEFTELNWLTRFPQVTYSSDKLEQHWSLLGYPPNHAYSPAKSNEIAQTHLEQAGLFVRTIRRLIRSTEEGGHAAHHLTLWGATGAGKTIYLSQLYNAGGSLIDEEDQAVWRFRVPEQRMEFFEAHRKTMQTERRLPAGTQQQDNANIDFELYRNQDLVAWLHLQDRWGAGYINLDESEVLQHLANAEGLLVLVDPTRPVLKNEQELKRLFEKTRQQNNVTEQRPVAVVFTKVDRWIDNMGALQQIKTDSNALVENHLTRPRLTDLLNEWCQNWRYFAISALGVQRMHRHVRPAMYFDGALQPRLLNEGETINLFAPIQWLLEQVQK